MTKQTPRNMTNNLSRLIAEDVKKQGAITFERFMDIALYHEELGYYSSGRAQIGKKGDFYTSPAVGSSFGKTLARVVSRLKKLMERQNCITVLEVGGGQGWLAFDILSELARTDPETYGLVEYILLDRCNPQQCAVTGKHKNFRRVKNFDEIVAPLTGIILSNELFDAIPFHRLIFRNGEIREIFVSCGEYGFVETEAAPSSGKLAEYFDRCGGVEKMGFVEGQQFEVCPGAAKLLKQMADAMKKGIILTIDYGLRTEELFSPERYNGTFKCLSEHKISESPYQKIGEQDITAHVDFGNLESTGEASGLATLKYTTQGQFLLDWGIMKIAERNLQEIPAIKNLFMPSMMGNRFRALMQVKNSDELKESFYPESPLKISFGL